MALGFLQTSVGYSLGYLPARCDYSATVISSEALGIRYIYIELVTRQYS
jgi:hypothetical protein